LVKGPSLPDRVVALDLMACLIMGFVIVFSILKDNQIFLDIVLVVTLVLFLATVAISRYLKKKSNDY
ncbi:MAG: monovalent cation/H+ antiporter complex subunit F, partial [bacterium]